MTSPLYNALLQQNINPADAQVIADAFPNEPPADFVDGMEKVAHVLGVTRTVDIFGPAMEPWSKIWSEWAATNTDLEKSMATVLTAYADDLRVALQNAILIRITAHASAAQQKKNSKRAAKSAEILRSLNAMGHSFKLNALEGIEDNGALMDDYTLATIQCAMNDVNENRRSLVLDVIYASAVANKYHPVRDYLNSLKFEGGDPIGDLTNNYFVCRYGMFGTFLKRWLIGACARAMNDNGVQNRMLVLDGEQGRGKSHFVKWLGSPLPKYFRQDAMDPHNDDDKRRLAEFWIWEVGELGVSMRKADWESIKGFLRTERTTYRRKYGRFETRLPALACFIGTINNEEGFLPTQDRMFYVEQIEKIDWKYEQEVDINQVWAQAMTLYLASESWEPTTDDERTQIQAINEDYRVLDIVEETLQNFFMIDPGNQNWWTSTLDIMQVLKDDQRGNLRGGELDTRKLARAMTKLGLKQPMSKKVMGHVLRGYYGIKLPP